MALVNRDKDASEQRDCLYWAAGAPPVAAGGATFGSGYVATGQTLLISGPMPYPYTLQSVNAISNGMSGAPLLTPLICRPMNGGFTCIAVSISALVVANTASFLVGPTGSLTYSGLVASGSTLLNGQRGDLIMVVSGGANTACSALLVNIVVKKTQDIVQMDGV